MRITIITRRIHTEFEPGTLINWLFMIHTCASSILNARIAMAAGLDCSGSSSNDRKFSYS